MTTKKKIVFLTGTRADFGKIKRLIKTVDEAAGFECFVFITGMHMLKKYGLTRNEVLLQKYSNVYSASNQTEKATSMDLILAKTIEKFNDYVKKVKPDMVVVHGDRVEALAGAIVGTLNNILVAHIEGGELSGTVDEVLRHAVSKLSHLHFVSNNDARQRLIQMGESAQTIFTIGSPDVDIMKSNNLPTLQESKSRYQIPFDSYAIFIFHPVVTEINTLSQQIQKITAALKKSGHNYVVIFPNNDYGSDLILEEYKKLDGHKNFKIFPSLRFEHFLTLLKHALYIIGNSSSGIREAEVYGTPAINIGSRQQNRSSSKNIIHVKANTDKIVQAIAKVHKKKIAKTSNFGEGDSAQKFFSIISNKKFWSTKLQKQFLDLDASWHAEK
jgi:UDP-N-acetylglucosamine 2-epimerase (hydrolysing)